MHYYLLQKYIFDSKSDSLSALYPLSLSLIPFFHYCSLLFIFAPYSIRKDWATPLLSIVITFLFFSWFKLTDHLLAVVKYWNETQQAPAILPNKTSSLTLSPYSSLALFDVNKRCNRIYFGDARGGGGGWGIRLTGRQRDARRRMSLWGERMQGTSIDVTRWLYPDYVLI